MSNELLLIVSLVASFGGLFLFFRLFGKAGCMAWTAVCTILANIEVMILVKAFGMEQTLGNTLFASSFLATDFLSELYGKKDADRAVWIGIATSCAFILFSSLWVLYTPSANDWAMSSVKTLFAHTPRILIASLAGYAVSELFDVWMYHKWWNYTTERSGSSTKYLWLRNNASTLVAQAANIVIFNFGAFFGMYDIKTLLSITGACYVIYICTSLLDTPFIYLARMMYTKCKTDGKWISG
ncbi:MAG: queuosine precursor transporter [Treponema sp.]|nr:queuosine precursor transporter [Treponema sp.]